MLEATAAGVSVLVATGITLSEVMVSQGVVEGAGLDEATLATGTTGTLELEGRGAGLEAGATLGVSELVATGITLSEVMVSQGVDEGELGTGATLEGASELVAIGITLSEVRVSQGVDEGELDEATLATGTTGTLELEGRGAGLEAGATLGVSELVAMGITLSEVRVSQGVDEGELDEATLETGTTGTLELTGRGAGLEGCAAGLEGVAELVAMGITLSEVRVSQGVDELEAGATLEGPAELVAMGTTLSEVRVSQGVDEAAELDTGATLEGVGMALTEPAGLELEGRGAGPVGT